jgi:membrane-bound metal-dependent hydrolase YbcI (DUF457 family)
MDSLAHFMLALMAGLAVGLHRRHKVRYVALVALLAVLIDLDHFLVLIGIGTVYRSMHNVFVAVMLPLLLFELSWFFERKTASFGFQTFFLLLTIMLAGHVIADMVGSPGVKLLYPFSNADYSLPDIVFALPNGWEIVGRDGVYLSIYGAVVFVGALIHDALYYEEKKKMGAVKAIKETVGDYF